ncbi:MAG: hypothetical protein ACREOO_17350 [bacterium]
MFFLLFKTRLHYYRNFLRAHFDRVTVIELACIGLIFLYLAARSPADIGYRPEAFFTPEFAARWMVRWLSLLPLFYFAAEFLAWVTLRPAGEWQILAALPFQKYALLRYQLARHFLKTASLLLIGILPFAIGRGDSWSAGLQSVTALVFMSALQLMAFAQAHLLRSRAAPARKWGRWGLGEIIIMAPLLSCSQGEFGVTLVAWSFGWTHVLAAIIFLIFCWMMINALMYVFEQDAAAISLMRILPVSAAQWWQARWWFTLGMLALPMLPPVFIIAFKFGFNLKLLAFRPRPAWPPPRFFHYCFAMPPSVCFP